MDLPTNVFMCTVLAPVCVVKQKPTRYFLRDTQNNILFCLCQHQHNQVVQNYNPAANFRNTNTVSLHHTITNFSTPFTTHNALHRSLSITSNLHPKC